VVPCCQCTRLSKICQYKAEYGRGRDPTISNLPSHRLENVSVTMYPNILNNNASQPETPQPAASIFKRTEDSMNRNVDPPLPPEPSIFLLPPVQTARKLIAVHFDSNANLNFLHRPSVEIWLNDMYTNFYLTREGSHSRNKNAVVFMVFASAYDLINVSPSDSLESR